MKLLVVTPTLGESPWLEETISSVAAVAGAPEHVLVAPADKVAALARRYPRVAVVAEPGGGMYAAINAGLAVGRAWDAFTYINDDDVLLPDFAAVVNAVREGGAGGPRIAYGGVRLIDAEGRRIGAIPISPTPEINRALYAQRLEPVFQHGTVATRAVVELMGGFNASLRFCGDSEFLARACLRGIPFLRVTRREVAAFRLRPGQLTKNRPAMIAERAQVDSSLELERTGPAAELRMARWRFRLANAPIYAERIVRHGFVSFDELLTRLG
ncbi:MAG: glycosyltransferase [Verrucomicrobiota bacterium]|jgi:glycosyltransferase involved in cell wall biosynthesis